MSISRTVIISCAGMGNRLGLGATKALVKVDGKPIIIRHLEMLEDVEDVRIVVGFQAEQVIELVNKYRKNILYVFNHSYKTSGTGLSVSLASQYANDYILTIDGDILIHPMDMNKILNYENEFIGGTIPRTDDPWLLKTHCEGNKNIVDSFSHEEGDYEWTGISQIKHNKIIYGRGHVYQLIEPILPMDMLEVRTREIDTINDYEHAEEWVRNGYV